MAISFIPKRSGGGQGKRPGMTGSDSGESDDAAKHQREGEQQGQSISSGADHIVLL
jgi:hypothetical protein